METIDTAHNLGKGHSVDLSHLAPVVLYDASDGVVPDDGQFAKEAGLPSWVYAGRQKRLHWKFFKQTAAKRHRSVGFTGKIEVLVN